MTDCRERAQAWVDNAEIQEANGSHYFHRVADVRGHWALLEGWAETGDGYGSVDIAIWYDFSVEPPSFYDSSLPPELCTHPGVKLDEKRGWVCLVCDEPPPALEIYPCTRKDPAPPA